MDVSIKSFDVEMDVKNKGIELEIREPGNGPRLGDLIITKSHLIWCKGKTGRNNGDKIKWSEFVEMVSRRQKPAKKTAPKKTDSEKTSVKTAATEPDTE